MTLEEFEAKKERRVLRMRSIAAAARRKADDFSKILKHSKKIVQEFKKLGFTYITLDIEGYRTGSLNEVLEK